MTAKTGTTSANKDAAKKVANALLQLWERNINQLAQGRIPATTKYSDD